MAVVSHIDNLDLVVAPHEYTPEELDSFRKAIAERRDPNTDARYSKVRGCRNPSFVKSRMSPFHGMVNHYGLTHVRIKPHCPEENGIMERSNRTVREALEEEELTG
jgi:hypothetical protein